MRQTGKDGVVDTLIKEQLHVIPHSKPVQHVGKASAPGRCHGPFDEVPADLIFEHLGEGDPPEGGGVQTRHPRYPEDEGRGGGFL